MGLNLNFTEYNLQPKQIFFLSYKECIKEKNPMKIASIYTSLNNEIMYKKLYFIMTQNVTFSALLRSRWLFASKTFIIRLVCAQQLFSVRSPFRFSFAIRKAKVKRSSLKTWIQQWVCVLYNNRKFIEYRVRVI